MDKVVLPDGRKGYVARQYLVDIPDITNCNDKIVTTTEVNFRNGPGLDGTTVYKMLSANVNATRIEQGKYNLDGHIWDRIVLEDGTKGYVAREYIKVQETPEFKVEDTDIIATPSFSVENLKKANEGKTIVVKDSKGAVVEKGGLGTGYKVSIDEKEYTMVKLGDLNGDIEVDVIDLALMKRHLTGTSKLKNEYLEAGILKSDKKDIDVVDLALLKRHLTNTQQIRIEQ